MNSEKSHSHEYGQSWSIAAALIEEPKKWRLLPGGTRAGRDIPSDDEELDLQKYGFVRMERHKHEMLLRWFLYEITRGSIQNTDELRNRAKAAMDFEKIASLKALGFADYENRYSRIEKAVEELFSRKWVFEDPLRLSTEGETTLNKALNTSSLFSAQGKPGPRSLRILFSFIGRCIGTGIFLALVYLFSFLLGFFPDLSLWSSVRLLSAEPLFDFGFIRFNGILFFLGSAGIFF